MRHGGRFLTYIFIFWFCFPLSVYPDVIIITAVGDIMLGTDFPENFLPPEDGKTLLVEVKEYLKGHIVMGNLEGVLCNDGVPSKIPEKGKVYLFRMPERYVNLLKEAGFNFLSLANNHAMDFGYECFERTKEVLSRAGIKFSSKSGEVADFKFHGVKIAVLSYSYGTPPRSINYINHAIREIKELNAKYDILVLSVHGGKEGRDALHLEKKEEFYLGENRGNPVRFARTAVDSGADLVVMHGPHVPRALEVYKKRLIAYSLGNFCTYKRFNISGEAGFTPVLQIKLNKAGELVEGRVFSLKQKEFTGPEPDPFNSAYNLIKLLSTEDFPETKPCFGPDNRFMPCSATSMP